MPWTGNTWPSPTYWPPGFFGTLEGPSFIGLEPTLHTFQEQWLWDGSDTWIAPRVADQVPYGGSGHPQVPLASPDPMGDAWKDALAGARFAMISFWHFGTTDYGSPPVGSLSYPSSSPPLDLPNLKDPAYVDRVGQTLWQLGDTAPPPDIPSVDDFPGWTFAPYGFPYGDPNFGVAGNRYGRVFTTVAPPLGYALPYVVVPDFEWGSHGWVAGFSGEGLATPDLAFSPYRQLLDQTGFAVHGNTGWLQSPEPPPHIDPDPANIVLWQPADLLDLTPRWIATRGSSGTEPFTAYNGAPQDGLKMVGGYTKIALVTFAGKLNADAPASGMRVL